MADVSPANDRLQTQEKSAALGAEQEPLRTDGKVELRCDWCREYFTPRDGSGGTKQRFCSRECQRTANRERQRTQRRAAYVAPRTSPRISQPTRNETLPRQPAVAALHPWETGVLDVANCQRTEFVAALNEGESAVLLAESWLEDLGCQVETALNGTEALAKLNDGEFNVEVLITDVNMPDMSGYELAKRAAAVRPGLKIVLMSGAAGYPQGLTLIRKPFFRDDLRRVIRSDAI